MSDYENVGRRGPGDFAINGPLPPGATEPVDVVQVRADDVLIAALGRADDPHIDDPIDERLAELLRTWRDDVHAEPQRPLVDVAAAHAALTSAPRPRRRQNPFGPWATAAAVLVIAFVGMGLAAKGAEPGDPLWNVTKVLYSEKAKSVEAAVTVRNKLEQASEALHSGRVSDAKVALQEAQSKLPVVAVEDGKQALATRTEELMAELIGSPPTPAPAMTSTTPSSLTSSVDPSPTETAEATVTTTEPPVVTSTEPPPPSSSASVGGSTTEASPGSATEEIPRAAAGETATSSETPPVTTTAT